MTDPAWTRYEANQKVPYLPSDDPDYDFAVATLRDAIAEIAPEAAANLGAVLRILRHRPSLAAEVLRGKEPICTGCGSDKKCLGCDDVRPTAEKLHAGWKFFSPLDRLETVERVEQANEYAPLRVWTDKTGPDYSWLIPRWTKLDAVAPPLRFHGTPEIRIREFDYSRDAPMYAVPTLSTVHAPEPSGALVEAGFERGKGWWVTHRPGGGDPVTIRCESKAKARTALRAAAREHAKALGVKVTL